LHPITYIRNWREERRARREQETTADRAARVTANATVWMAVFTALLFVLNGITVLILSNQLKEMHEGGVDTHALAQASSDQADAAQQFSDTAEDINGDINGAVDQLEAAAKNTRTTIRSAQTQFRDEQRAWVGFQDTASGEFSEKTGWVVRVIFFNSGRSPARNVQESSMFRLSPNPLPGPLQTDIKQLVFRPAQSVAPQSKLNLDMGEFKSGEPFTEDQTQGQQLIMSHFQEIRDKKYFLYYFGIVKYDDVFGGPHETQYCIFLANPTTKEVGICDAFNDLN
jgi:hypothetical protein